MQEIPINIQPDDEFEKIYGKWNLVFICKPAGLLQDKIIKSNT